MNEDWNAFKEGMAEAEQRHEPGGMYPAQILELYDKIQRRDAAQVTPYVRPADNPMKPMPEYPPASMEVICKRILIGGGVLAAVYSVGAFVAANAVWIGGAVVGLVLLSAMFGGNSGKPSGGQDFGGHGAHGGNSQTINITVNAPNGGNVNVNKG